MSQNYPIGIETFQEIIEGGYIYVDKTESIYEMSRTGKYLFLSRPRRFGKSLMLSTLEAYFEGRRELFDGLWLGQAAGVDWTPHAVLRLNFVEADPSSVANVEALVANHLDKWERKYDIPASDLPLGQRFRNIIEKAAADTGNNVVILIDEYDKVLVNTLEDDDMHDGMRAVLRPLFAVLKGADRYIKFAMITGVSRFSKLSIFSDLNNIRDISLTDGFSTVCGFTPQEVESNFSQGIQEMAVAKGVSTNEMIQLLKDNYDGYHFSEACRDVYNPYSLLSAFAEKKLLHKWFETGTPTFLLEKLHNTDEDLQQLLSPMASGYSLSALSIADNDLINMLYQTGYLTIKGYDAEDDMYMLGIPNQEVETGLYRCLLPMYTGRDMTVNDGELYKLRRAVRAGDVDRFMSMLKSFMAGIPQHLSEGKHEIYYENNIYLILRLIGFEIRTEEQTSDGRIDAVLKTPKFIYVIELKLNGTAQQAMQQILDRNYARPYEFDGRRIIKIGISFSKQTRTIDEWVAE